MFRKAIVLGCPGAGKSFFSRKLAELKGLPLYHLDMIYHRADKTHIGREEFDARLAEILSREEWLIDGNYNRTIETRLRACETVFLFDIPLEVCLAGAAERVGTVRPDLPWTETELDRDFELFIREFPGKHLPEIYSLLENHPEKELVIFRTREQAEEYLSMLSDGG